ncbi:hypothetical protein CBLAS_0291 [Campylobacter blaseri]|uniref:Uncharacterized protein n=1 Tax=Campylobacter blaseri TaxID=2042961 RepID=A0A2P8R1C8_9BACT|nr:hypothetical protein [Campylobacter blaseri]PSM52292.1 hypothetical protein CQ405_04360 [Campylobacter blaseri]PSM54058.1 hypothetical protein CRN67_04360 [Campylobacter blaseri]QKF85499.1 hypothetical protein CBLAS_0291 [Campylobacter blaseri]
MKIFFQKTILITSFIIALSFFWFSNSLYATDKENVKSIELSNDVLLEESYRNKIVHYIGIVSGIYETKEGIKNIYFEDKKFSKRIIATIFPSFGKIETIHSGDKVKVTGYVKIYKNKAQINPLDKSMIEILEFKKNKCIDSINFSDIPSNLGNTIFLNNVKALNIYTFTSKNGKKHINFKLSKDGYIYNAIVFEGFYNDKIKGILKNNNLFCAKVKVSEYKGDISLIIKEIYE